MTKSITGLSEVTTVGLDLAKHVFQVHCLDASGAVSWPSPSKAVFHGSGPLAALHPSLSSYADRQKSAAFWCYDRGRLAPHAAINVPIRSSGRENPKAPQITISQ